MAEEQKSSLRSAIENIMGWPSQAQPSGFQLDPAKQNLETVSAISNVVPETVADPLEAQVAEIEAQNAELSSSLTPTATTTPAASTWGADLLALQKQYATMPQVLTTLDQAKKSMGLRDAMTKMSLNKPEGVTAPSVQDQMAALYPNYNKATNSWKPQATAAPVNPGAGAPWQASQQYWKDLAAYNAKK